MQVQLANTPVTAVLSTIHSGPASTPASDRDKTIVAANRWINSDKAKTAMAANRWIHSMNKCSNHEMCQWWWNYIMTQCDKTYKMISRLFHTPLNGQLINNPTHASHQIAQTQLHTIYPLHGSLLPTHAVNVWKIPKRAPSDLVINPSYFTREVPCSNLGCQKWEVKWWCWCDNWGRKYIYTSVSQWGGGVLPPSPPRGVFDTSGSDGALAMIWG